jgi:nicotinate-nucleotide adenylyltransferase
LGRLVAVDADRLRAGMRRIGLFGGSFDPVHRGHLALAEAALEGVALDQILWIPAGHPWQKSRRLAPAEDRASMIEIAIAHEPRFRLERIELNRAGPSYTLDTVTELQAAASMLRAEWFLLIGQDQYARLSTWHGWRKLVQRVTFAVAARDGQVPTPDPQLAALTHRQLVIPMPAVDVSSTTLRARAAAGQSLAGMVPSAVEGYIASHGLYRPPGAASTEAAPTTPETPC